MKTYVVWVNFSGCARYIVEADSEDDAYDAAISMADVTDCDEWDYDIAECRED